MTISRMSKSMVAMKSSAPEAELGVHYRDRTARSQTKMAAHVRAARLRQKLIDTFYVGKVKLKKFDTRHLRWPMSA
jgi:hypothetical protein